MVRDTVEPYHTASAIVTTIRRIDWKNTHSQIPTHQQPDFPQRRIEGSVRNLLIIAASQNVAPLLMPQVLLDIAVQDLAVVIDKVAGVLKNRLPVRPGFVVYFLNNRPRYNANVEFAGEVLLWYVRCPLSNAKILNPTTVQSTDLEPLHPNLVIIPNRLPSRMPWIESAQAVFRKHGELGASSFSTPDGRFGVGKVAGGVALERVQLEKRDAVS